MSSSSPARYAQGSNSRDVAGDLHCGKLCAGPSNPQLNEWPIANDDGESARDAQEAWQWATEIAPSPGRRYVHYIPMRRGFIYLTAVLDWATRRVLAWRLSNSLADVAVAVLEDAIARCGVPVNMNGDQGSRDRHHRLQASLRMPLLSGNMRPW
jgi:transposase InsO family protein